MLFNTPIFFVFFVVFLLIYGLILLEERELRQRFEVELTAQLA